jgi:hypothetical protein
VVWAQGRTTAPLVAGTARFNAHPLPWFAFARVTVDYLIRTDLLIQLISQRYERRSIALTTNLPFEKWTQVFPDEMAATAVIDRLVHHGSVFAFAGKSHRLRSRGK